MEYLYGLVGENGEIDEKEMSCIKEKKQKLLSLFQQGLSSVLQQRTEIRQKAVELGNLFFEKISPLGIQFNLENRVVKAQLCLYFEMNTLKWRGCY